MLVSGLAPINIFCLFKISIGRGIEMSGRGISKKRRDWGKPKGWKGVFGWQFHSELGVGTASGLGLRAQGEESISRR
jgi:hypothetical protein